MAPAPMRIAPVAPTSSALRSSARSTSGASTRRSTTTKPTAASTDTSRQPRVGREAHPQEDPFVTANTKGASTAATRTVPATSMLRARVGSRDSGTVQQDPRDADHGDGGVDPEQPLPPGRLVEESSDDRAGRGAGRRRGAPQGHGTHLPGALRRHREQAQARGQDGRAGGALDDATGHDQPARGREGDQGAGGDEQGQARRRTPDAARRRPPSRPRSRSWPPPSADTRSPPTAAGRARRRGPRRSRAAGCSPPRCWRSRRRWTGSWSRAHHRCRARPSSCWRSSLAHRAESGLCSIHRMVATHASRVPPIRSSARRPAVPIPRATSPSSSVTPVFRPTTQAPR